MNGTPLIDLQGKKCSCLSQHDSKQKSQKVRKLVSGFPKSTKAMVLRFPTHVTKHSIKMNVKKVLMIEILKPAVACNRVLVPLHNKVGFEILKLEKMAFFFEKSVIYLGVCITQIATSYKFLNLCQPSHGAYCISSDGLSYHSKLPEYEKKKSGVHIYSIYRYHLGKEILLKCG